MWGELWEFPFHAQVWGTVGQWASALGTTSALSATLYIIARDRRIRQRELAEKISIRIDDVTIEAAEEKRDQHENYQVFYHRVQRDGPFTFDVRLHNPTDAAITDVYILTVAFRSWQYRRFARQVPSHQRDRLPGIDKFNKRASRSFMAVAIDELGAKETKIKRITTKLPPFLFTPMVTFRDTHGHQWIRYLYTRKLIPYSSTKANKPVFRSYMKWRDPFRL